MYAIFRTNEVFSGMFCGFRTGEHEYGGQAERTLGELVSGHTLVFWHRNGVGRAIVLRTTVADGHPVVVLGYDYWKQRSAAIRKLSENAAGEQLSDGCHRVFAAGI